MKNRRIILISFLLVTTLCVGIGYAAVQQTLTVTGNGSVGAEQAEEAFQADVKFDSNVVKGGTGSGNHQGNTASASGNQATFNVTSLQGKGDTATFKFKVVNAGDLDATVAVPQISMESDEYFQVTTDWGDSEKSLTAGGNLEFTVTVTLLKTPVTDVSMKEATITITATADGSQT